MKRLLILAMFLPVFALSQYNNVAGIFKTFRTGAVIQDSSYTSGRLDTTQALSFKNFASAYVWLQSKDSASIMIQYQVSLNGGTNWSLLTTLDSLSTGSNTGDFNCVAMPAKLLGMEMVRFVFSTSAFRPAVSSNTYTAGYTLKRY